MDTRDVYADAVETYGNAMQTVVAIEELSELQKELCKAIRGTYSEEETKERIAEEVADVEIMISQLMIIFHIDRMRINRHKVKKLMRLRERMSRERGKK